jgi:DNA mismatch repair protein MutS
VDLSTGELRQTELSRLDELSDLLTRLTPREVVLAVDDADLRSLVVAILPEVTVSTVASSYFDAATGAAWLGQTEVAPDVRAATRAALGAVMRYLRETHRASLDHLRTLQADIAGARLEIDEATRRHLELISTTRGERRGSLLWVLDQTETPMGSRQLRQWVLEPLTDIAAISDRLNAVEELVERAILRQQLAQTLRTIGDLERLTARLTTRRVTPRDLLGLAASLGAVHAVRAMMGDAQATAIVDAAAQLDPLPAVQARIGATIADEPPLSARNGGVIRTGYDARVDELRGLAHQGKRFISELEASERARSGISSLKVRYNNVFGYYIEITKANLHLVPTDYTRKQTVANAERFVTPQLQEYEAKVLGAEERLNALEAALFDELVTEVAAAHASLAGTARALARLDTIASLAVVAERHRYTRPQLCAERRIMIEEGRHPVVELMVGRKGFVPNDVTLDPQTRQLIILTGPNMAGKSTYLRQVALTALMAQMGSFVPAAKAELGIVDRLFTRIGASDNLSAGESTFMVEMKETAHIVNHLTARSLVVLDEIGRGTSTFDGISIAWAVAEYLHDAATRPLVLFATHYHEMTDLTRTKERAHNCAVAVQEWKGEVVFLRRIVEGRASQSYGIQVARLAGVPDPVITRAQEILGNLERGELTDAGMPRLAQRKEREDREQLALFTAPENRLRSELSAMDVERMTPVEALNRLHELVERARKTST